MSFFIRFPSYGMLYRLRNAWVFPLTFVSMEKFSKTNDMGDTWGIDSHNSHKLWLIFHRIPTWEIYVSFLWISHGLEKYSYIHFMGPYSPPNSYPMLYYVIWMWHGFSRKFSVLWVNSAKPSDHTERTWKIYSCAFLKTLIISVPTKFCPMRQ